MKKMYSKTIYCIFLCMILLFSSCTNSDNISSDQNSSEALSTESSNIITDNSGDGMLTVPEELSSISNSKNTIWSAGIYALLYDLTVDTTDSQLAKYDYVGGVINGRVDMASDSNEKEPYHLIILCDGKPVSFTSDGKEWSSYPVLLDRNGCSLEISFDPKLKEDDCGRLDFIIICDLENARDFYFVCFTVCLKDDALQSNQVSFRQGVTTAEMRKGLDNTVNGYTYMSWLNDASMIPDEGQGINLTDIKISEDGKYLAEGICGFETIYRIVFFVDQQMISVRANETDYDYMDWNNEQGTMFQQQIALEPTVINENSSFYTLIIPLGSENIKKAVLCSRKITFTK